MICLTVSVCREVFRLPQINFEFDVFEGEESRRGGSVYFQPKPASADLTGYRNPDHITATPGRALRPTHSSPLSVVDAPTLRCTYQGVGQPLLRSLRLLYFILEVISQMSNDELLTDDYVAGLLAQDANDCSLKYSAMGMEAFRDNKK